MTKRQITMYRYKNIIKTKSCIVWLSMILYLIAPLGATEGLVLCFGADGHIMVEPAPIGYHQCGHFSREAQKVTSCIHSASGSDFSTGKCTSCIDIPLFINIFGQCRRPDQNTVMLIKSPAISTYPFFLSAFANILVGNSSLKPLIHDHSMLDSIRSSILLI